MSLMKTCSLIPDNVYLLNWWGNGVKGYFWFCNSRFVGFFAMSFFYYLFFVKFYFHHFLLQIWLPWCHRFIEGNMSAENPETRLMGSWWIRCRPQGGASDLARTQRSGRNSREGLCAEWKEVAPEREGRPPAPGTALCTCWLHPGGSRSPRAGGQGGHCQEELLGDWRGSNTSSP